MPTSRRAPRACVDGGAAAEIKGLADMDDWI